MPTLVLIRHAKTEGHGGDDHSRNLVPRGHAQAATLGPQIAELTGDARVLVSSANRAVQTWAGIASGLGEVGDVEVSDDLYTFAGRELLERIRTWAEGEVVIAVGHNPAVSGVVAALLGQPPPDDPALASGGALRTARGAVLDIGRPWSDLAPGTATLQKWLIPTVD